MDPHWNQTPSMPTLRRDQSVRGWINPRLRLSFRLLRLRIPLPHQLLPLQCEAILRVGVRDPSEVFLTDGPTRHVKLGKRTITLVSRSLVCSQPDECSRDH